MLRDHVDVEALWMWCTIFVDGFLIWYLFTFEKAWYWNLGLVVVILILAVVAFIFYKTSSLGSK